MHEISDIYGTEDADYSDYYDKMNADCDITIVNGYITGLSIKLSAVSMSDGYDIIRIRLQLNHINSDSVKVDMDKLNDINDKADLYGDNYYGDNYYGDDYYGYDFYADDYDYSDDFYNEFGYSDSNDDSTSDCNGDSNDGNGSEDTDGVGVVAA